MKNNQQIIIDDPAIKLLLRGGLVLPHDSEFGLVVLLRGKAGTGKSTLALQLLDRIDESGSAKRFYCTLEQSKDDLKFKLASMLAAKALQDSMVADYGSTPPVFKCEFNLIWNSFLKNRLRPSETGARVESEKAIKSVFDKQLNAKTQMPLYGEPKDTPHKEEFDKFRVELTSTIGEFLTKDRITVLPDKNNGRKNADEGSLRLLRNRVLIAAQMLKDAKELANETHDGKKSRRISRSRLPIVIMDGLSLLTAQERGIAELQNMVETIRRDFQLGILVYEPGDDESTSLDHQADMVIELTRRDINLPLAYQIHEMCFRKSRYQEAALGQHQYKIRASGIAVFPSLHFQVHHHNYMDMELKRSSGAGWLPSREEPSDTGIHFKGEGKEQVKGSLLDLLFDPRPGESIVLLGPRNSFKTQLCFDFLSCGYWGCPASKDNAEKGLLVSLTDNAPEIQKGLECPWGKGKYQAARNSPNECNGCSGEGCLLKHARAFCQRPGCITPAEFFYYLNERIHFNDEGMRVDDPEIKRIVFWDLTQMDYRFPLFKEDKMLLPAMMDRFKTKDLKSLFMGAGNADNTPAAAAMADHVAFCWRSARTYANDVKSEAWPYAEEAKSSLMVYVDRVSAISKISGNTLYCVPVDNSGRLMMPQNSEELKLCLVDHRSPAVMRQIEPDVEEIKRINLMQGVR